MAKNLRVATEADVPEPPMTVGGAVRAGSRLDQLVAMQRVAADAIDAGPAPRDLKALMLSVDDFEVKIQALRAEDAETAREATKSNVVTDKKWRAEAI